MTPLTQQDLIRRSAVEAFGCPYRYQKIYLEHVDDAGDESLRGRAFHAAAWIYVLRLAAIEQPSDHEEAKRALQTGLSIIGLPDHLVPQTQRLFLRWAEHFELDLDAFLAAEEIVQRGRRTFRPDLVYCRPQEIEIIDFKTYYKGLTERQARDELQLRWYLIEARKAWPGFSRYRFTYDFVRLGYRVSLAFTEDEIEGFEAGVQGAIDAVAEAERTGLYPPLPGSHCTLCRLACPVADDPARLPVRLLTADDAGDAFGQVLVLEQKLKALRKILSGWCKANGPILLRGQIYQHVAETTVTYPMDLVADYVVHDPDRAKVQVSQQALKPVYPRVRDIPAALRDAAVRKQGWKFRHRKAGEVQPELVDGFERDDDGDDDE